jgi:large subunit ribosomal protein L21e
MVKRIGRARRKTRYQMTKHVRRRGKLSLSSFFKSFKEGDKIILNAEPAVQKGIYFRRFHGKTGIIQGKTGSCYRVLIRDKKKNKTIIVHPVHLKKA